MAISELRLIMRWAENQPREEITNIPARTRGLYALLKKRVKLKNKYDVVYIGMAATGGIKSRLRSHARSESKRDLWTHFSIFEVWPNITASEVEELEGLFRHIYRKDTRANRINRQRSFKKLSRIRNNKLQQWPQNESTAC
jgi:hypothetical protein